MKIREIKAKSIITKSGLPEADLVINPYVGCSHACLYCYARFMKRFSGHPEPWGCFVDAKINAPGLVPADTDKYENKTIVVGSVTDPYQPLESECGLTRRILEKLIPLGPRLNIITKSDLVLRDVDLLKKLSDCTVAVSASFLDEKARKRLEPGAIATMRRLEALEKLRESGIRTVLFVSPIFPGITDWKGLADMTRDYADEYWFENLNLYPSIRNNVYGFLKAYDSRLVSEYELIYSPGSGYWDEAEGEIGDYCANNGLGCRIFFHHKKK